MSHPRSFVTVDDVETQSFDWGKLQWLTEPRVTGSQCMVSGIVTLDPGQGHARHNHPGCCENLFILEGEGEQMIEQADGRRETRKVGPGVMISLQRGQYHSTFNVGTGVLRILACYEFAGPEAALRADPGCTVIPPRSSQGQ